MLYEICDKMERVSAAFDPQKADRYAALKQNVKEAIIRAFYQAEEHTYGYDGTDGVALSLGIYPEGERQSLIQSLAKRTKQSGYQMTTAIYSTKYLIPTLLTEGFGKEAMEMLFSLSHPAFGTMLAQGAATLWECLEMQVPELDPAKRMHSLNHPMHGGFLYALYTHVAGISPKTPGYKSFAFSPAKNCPLGSFKASITSPYGQIQVQMEQSREHTRYSLSIPENSQGILDIPWAKTIKINQTPAKNGQALGSGQYKIVITQ